MENIDRYYKDIRKTQPFTFEQEKELGREIKAGNRAALDKLVKANLRFVVTEARKHQGKGLDLTDLIQEGNIGLIRAAEKFDPEAGFRFITYAVWWIRQSIFAALSDNRLMRLPMNMVGIYNQIAKATSLFRTVEDREPSDTELSIMTGIKLEDIQLVTIASASTASLSKVIGNDEDGGTLEDFIEDSDAVASDASVEAEGCTIDLKKIVTEHLSEREAFVLLSNFGIGCKALSDEQVGKLIKVSEERVKQIKLAALRKLKKNPVVIEALREYLG